jgi:hypothetical protein
VEIKNNTPWDTKALTAFIEPILTGSALASINIENHKPVPGTKKAEQQLCRIECDYVSWQGGPPETRATIYLLSPKRAKSRMTPLDRLAYVNDIKPGEVPLPKEVIEDISHALRWLVAHPGRPYNDRRPHLRSRSANPANSYDLICNCQRPLDSIPLIRGDTGARIRPPVTAASLKRKLRYLESEIDSYQDALSKCQEKRERLLTRLANAEKREAAGQG